MGAERPSARLRSEVVELALIRHGQPEWVRNGTSVVNPPLTDLGHAQAGLTAQALVDEAFDDVFVSPLQRARQTVAPFLAATNRDEVIEPWLEEIRDPDWHGQPAEGAAKAYQARRELPSTELWSGLPGGEPMRDFVARVRAGADDFLARHGIRHSGAELPVWTIDDPGRKVAFVAHAGTNSVIVCHLLGLPPTPWEWDRLVMRHASISRLVAMPVGDGHVFSLTSLSDVEHLPSDHRTA